MVAGVMKGTGDARHWAGPAGYWSVAGFSGRLSRERALRGLAREAAVEAVVDLIAFEVPLDRRPPFQQEHQPRREHPPVAEPGLDLGALPPAAAAERAGQELFALDR